MANARLDIELTADAGNVRKELAGVSKEAERAGASLQELAKDGGIAISSLNKISPAAAQISRATSTITKSSASAGAAVTDLSRIVQDAPFAFINFGAVANNIDPLFLTFRRLTTEAGSVRAALGLLGKAFLGGGGIGFAISAVTSLITASSLGLLNFGGSAKESASRFKVFNDELAKLAAGEGAKGVANIEKLQTVITNLAIPFNQRIKAIQEYNKEADKQNKINETDITNVEKLNSLINSQINLLIRRAAIKGAEDKISGLTKILIENELKLTNAAEKSEVELNRFKRGIDELTSTSTDMEEWNRDFSVMQKSIPQLGVQQVVATQRAIAATKKQIADLLNFIDVQVQKGGAFGSVFEGVKPPKEKKLQLPFTLVLQPPDDIRIEEFIHDLRQKLEKFNLQKAIFGDSLKLPPETAAGISKGISDQFAIMQARAKDATEKLKQQIQAVGQFIDSTLGQAFRSLFDALIEGENPIKAFFDSLLKAAQQVVSQIIAEFVKIALLKLIFGTVTGGAGAIPGLATGGPVNRNRPYIVGERGPELFVPDISGQIIPNGGSASTAANIGLMDTEQRVQFVISGNNLIGVMSNAQRSQGRLV